VALRVAVVRGAISEEIRSMKLLEEAAERVDASVGAFAASGEDDAVEIACAVGGGEEAPLAWAELDEAASALIVENDDGLAAGDVAACEDVIGEAWARGEGAGHAGGRRIPENSGRVDAPGANVASRWCARYALMSRDTVVRGCPDD